MQANSLGTGYTFVYDPLCVFTIFTKKIEAKTTTALELTQFDRNFATLIYSALHSLQSPQPRMSQSLKD
jgi:hypothetical protein